MICILIYKLFIHMYHSSWSSSEFLLLRAIMAFYNISLILLFSNIPKYFICYCFISFVI